MKKIKLFYIDGCPYCTQGEKALAQLIAENPAYADIEIERIEEMENPEKAEDYDYQVVPCMFIGNEKVYESHLFEKPEEAKAKIRVALDKALAD